MAKAPTPSKPAEKPAEPPKVTTPPVVETPKVNTPEISQSDRALALIVADLIDLALSHDDDTDQEFAVPPVMEQASEILRSIVKGDQLHESITLRGLLVDIEGIAERRLIELQRAHKSVGPYQIGITLIETISLSANRSLQIIDHQARQAAADERSAKRLEERLEAARLHRAAEEHRANERAASIAKKKVTK